MILKPAKVYRVEVRFTLAPGPTLRMRILEALHPSRPRICFRPRLQDTRTQHWFIVHEPSLLGVVFFRGGMFFMLRFCWPPSCHSTAHQTASTYGSFDHWTTLAAKKTRKADSKADPQSGGPQCDVVNFLRLAPPPCSVTPTDRA